MIREDLLGMAAGCSMTLRNVETHFKKNGPHLSARYLILFFSEADAMMTLGERMLSLVDGCIVFVPPQAVYSFSYGSRCRYYCLSFEPVNGEKSALLRRMYEKRTSIIHPSDKSFIQCLQFQVEQLYRMLHQDLAVLLEYRESYTAACFSKLIMDVSSLQEEMEVKLPQDQHQLLTMQLTAYLDENYLSATTLTQLEKVFFLSRFHLCRLFKTQMEMSIVDYIHWKRVQHAIGLLAGTDRSITKICYESGFGSLQSFYTVFRRYTQNTPLQYKKSRLEKGDMGFGGKTGG